MNVKDYAKIGVINFLEEKPSDKPGDYCYGFLDKNAGWVMPVFFPTEEAANDYFEYLKKRNKKLGKRLMVCAIHKLNARDIFIGYLMRQEMEQEGDNQND